MQQQIGQASRIMLLIITHHMFNSKCHEPPANADVDESALLKPKNFFDLAGK
jgi:hypothetical protein